MNVGRVLSPNLKNIMHKWSLHLTKSKLLKNYATPQHTSNKERLPAQNIVQILSSVSHASNMCASSSFREAKKKNSTMRTRKKPLFVACASFPIGSARHRTISRRVSNRLVSCCQSEWLFTQRGTMRCSRNWVKTKAGGHFSSWNSRLIVIDAIGSTMNLLNLRELCEFILDNIQFICLYFFWNFH